LAAVTSLTGCSTWGPRQDSERTAGRVVDDTKITAQVKTDLNREPVYKFNDVDVKTFNGVVQLSGFVNTDEQKRRAGEIAQQAYGVAQVVNSITLKPNITPTGRPLDPNGQVVVPEPRR
jgi:osmotically-inducible protein OsmY